MARLSRPPTHTAAETMWTRSFRMAMLLTFGVAAPWLVMLIVMRTPIPSTAVMNTRGQAAARFRLLRTLRHSIVSTAVMRAG